MSRRPKDIGTDFATGVIRYLCVSGFDQAELRNQAGAHDKGDIIGTPGVAWECKGGKAAEVAGDATVTAWLAETETERRHAGADVGVLVMKRAGIGRERAGAWWALMTSHNVTALTDADATPTGPNVPVRMYLGDAVDLLRHGGYGAALPISAEAELLSTAGQSR